MAKDKQRCSEMVADPGSRGFRFHQCTRAAVVTEDGEPYCKVHAPSARRQRSAESYRKARLKSEQMARWSLSEADQKRLAMFPKLVKALEKSLENWPTVASWKKDKDAMLALIAKAKELSP